MCTDLLVTLPILNSGTIISGTLSQLTGQSDGICPGDNVIFTCVVGGGVTSWTFSPPGESDRICTYLSALNQTTCERPDERFRISQTEGSASNFNSSLSLASITENLNKTMVV